MANVYLSLIHISYVSEGGVGLTQEEAENYAEQLRARSNEGGEQAFIDYLTDYMTENGTTDQGTVISQNGKIKLILQIPESLQNQNSKKDRTY